jgi:hypothetical protein
LTLALEADASKNPHLTLRQSFLRKDVASLQILIMLIGHTTANSNWRLQFRHKFDQDIVGLLIFAFLDQNRGKALVTIRANINFAPTVVKESQLKSNREYKGLRG